MATLWVKTTTYESVEVGDDLPILVKHESQETIDSYAQYSGKDLGPGWHNLHTEPEYAAGGIFGGTVNPGAATVAYVAELLEKAFPIKVLMGHGSRLEMQATKPIRPGDTITFTGRVTAKLEEEDLGLVDCEVTGTNQFNQVVARAKATVSFSARVEERG